MAGADDPRLLSAPSAGKQAGAAATPQVSGELAALLNSVGVDMGSLLAGGSSTSSADDPPVFLGRGAAVRAPLSPNPEQTKPLSAMNGSFYSLTPSELIEFQRRMVAAGLLEAPRYGDYDDDSYKLWAAVNERAARFNAVGVKRTPNDVIDMIVAAKTDDPSDVDLEMGDPGNVSKLVSPRDLESQVQQAGRTRLGRKLTRKQVSEFLAIYDGIQRRDISQTRAAGDAAAPGEGFDGRDSVITDAASPGAAAEQFIDSNFAQEAAGQDSYGYLQALEQMIGGGR